MLDTIKYDKDCLKTYQKRNSQGRVVSPILASSLVLICPRGFVAMRGRDLPVSDSSIRCALRQQKLIDLGARSAFAL